MNSVRGIPIIVALSFCLSTIAWAAGSAIDVKAFGAVGDGKHDDTAAIQKALDEASSLKRGGNVVLPAGEYRVTKTLTIEGALLSGLSDGGWPADNRPLPMIRVDFTDGPCILAKMGASVHGLTFEYDHKGERPRKFGPTILLSGGGISLTNLTIHFPYEGIMADGESNIGRLNLENIFIISAWKCGVYVTHTLDIPTLRNVEVWNTVPELVQEAIGFKFGRNDGIRIDDCFAFNCKVGYLFVKDKHGNTRGQMTGCCVDFSAQGVVVEDATELVINGLSSWSHGCSLRLDGPGRITVAGSDLRSNGEPAIISRKCGSLTVTGCSLGKNGDGWPTVPAVRIEGGDNVLISACTMDANGPGVVIEKGANNFSITNNMFQPSPFEAMTDHSEPGANKIISGNLSKKIPAPPKDKAQ